MLLLTLVICSSEALSSFNLTTIFQSLMLPYLSYVCLSGIRQLNQKRTIRMKYFLKPPTHAVPFFSFLSNYYRYCSNALMLFFESVLTRPLNLCMRIALPQQLSVTSSLSVIIQYYYSSSENFYRLSIQD